MPHRRHHRRRSRHRDRNWNAPTWNSWNSWNSWAPPTWGTSPNWGVPTWGPPLGPPTWDYRWPYPARVDAERSCLPGGTREGVLFLERDCAGFPVGPRCCAGQKEVVYCNGNVEGGMSVGALQCLAKDD